MSAAPQLAALAADPPAPRALRALSLWQPHASVAAILRPPPNPERVAFKEFETRGKWAASFPVGIDLVIHAAKSREDLDLADEFPFDFVLAARGLSAATLPLGAAVAVVRVVATWTSTADGLMRLIDAEWRTTLTAKARVLDLPEGITGRLGDFSPGRVLIQMADVRPLRAPVPMRGRQGLFTLSAEEEAAVRAEMPPC
jgi:hypothetical protein